MFIGGVVAATVELINSDSRPVHEFGAASRWIVMYPSDLVYFHNLVFAYNEVCPFPSEAVMHCPQYGCN